ncbi:MAG TPA: alpha/beta hydrolase [Acidobacteriaceae bacterium]|jgi:acetyl esterase/lipase|nr:alpha/beta hydrolase [Acidobacteriaceae bacterium]
MKRQALAHVLSLSLAFLSLPLLATISLHAQTVLPLWPHGTPEPPQTSAPETDVTRPTDRLISGHRSARLTNVTVPTLSVFSPPDSSMHRHAAALVFPGGGYVRLAWDGEGLDTCRWLNSIGVTCLLVKYRVPEQGRYPDNPADLEDAQQAMRLARAHAAAWHINPHKIGVIGFSAGAHLAVALSTHWDDAHVESTPAASQVDAAIGAHPDFALIIYPGYLNADSTMQSLTPTLTPRPGTPPTFLLQAEDDPVHVENSLVYFRALKDAGIPTELHIYATGGHGFGLHPVGSPEEHWTQTATIWLRSLNMLPPAETTSGSAASFQAPAATSPCPAQQPPLGRPSTTQSATNAAADNPACW